MEEESRVLGGGRSQSQGHMGGGRRGRGRGIGGFQGQNDVRGRGRGAAKGQGQDRGRLGGGGRGGSQSQSRGLGRGQGQGGRDQSQSGCRGGVKSEGSKSSASSNAKARETKGTAGKRAGRSVGEKCLREWFGLKDKPSELVPAVMSYLPELGDFLASTSVIQLHLELLFVVLGAFLKVKGFHECSFTSLLRILADSDFFKIHSHLYLKRHSKSSHCTPFVETILGLMVQVGKLLPLKVHSLNKLFAYISKEFSSVPGISTLLTECKTQFDSASTRTKNRARSESQKGHDTEEPPDDIMDLPVLPTKEDLDAGVRPFLRANRVKGCFKDNKHYFDVIFRLVREDFIQPLREGLEQYRLRGGLSGHDSNLMFYDNVRIVGLEINNGIEHILSLDMSKLQNVRWDMDKRLIYGSLVCLSHDGFHTLIYGVVSQFERGELKRGILRVKFANCLDDVYTFPTESRLQMTESPSYFEAYRHVLEGLKEMSRQKLPMAEHLVQCSTKVAPPAYLTSGTEYNIRSAMRTGRPTAPRKCSLLNKFSWPAQSETCLNERQYQAVKMALTSKLALLQGPPGTGKTYVGLRIMEILLKNTEQRSANDTDPILVICYTNHALDQFLKEMLEFCPDGIVRVGGRSSSEALKSFNLNVLREKHKQKRRSHHMGKALFHCYREMKNIGSQIEAFAYRMQRAHLEIQPESVLRAFMNSSQYASLTSDQNMKGRNVMKTWLNCSTRDLDTHLRIQTEERLASLILTGGDMRDEEELQGKDLDKMHADVRARLYRFWVYNVCEAGQQMDVSAFMPDAVLWPFIKRKLFEHIKARFPNCQGHSVRAWLLGESLVDMLDTLEELQSQARRVKTSVLDDEEEYRRTRDQRLLADDCDENTDQKATKPRESSIIKRAYLLGLDVAGQTMGLSEEESEWKTARKPLSFGAIVRKLKSSLAMSESHTSQVSNVWLLPMTERFQLYKYWLSKHLRQLNGQLRKYVQEYDELLERKCEMQQTETVSILKGAKIIGMTTTGAAKHRKVLQEVSPRVVLVEEAAEVLEAHITTALSKHSQHLILIGDHQQLRPKTSVHSLAKDFDLDVSMFERLVNNGIECVQLTEQHRMRPEIAEYMRHIYPSLTDGERVKDREGVKGMKESVFFITHEEPEAGMSQSKSKLNHHEAKYLISLCQYLVLQGYSQEEITILGAYGGQITLIKDYAKANKKIADVRVSTVDNYQGEQNKIILLSLVRSNKGGSVGFLSTDNRVCVALSRAQYGMYVVANVDLLASKSALWRKIRATASDNKCVGRVLELKCQRHGRVTNVTSVEDLEKLKDGGCGKTCGHQLDCGHLCPSVCHTVSHSLLKCNYPCSKKCKEGHPCPAKCFQKCPPCKRKVSRELPCGHVASIKCSEKPHKVSCQEPCPKACHRGHSCAAKCSEVCPPCEVKVKKLLRCGHKTVVACSAVYLSHVCVEPCAIHCPCGHPCVAKCSQKCPPCSTRVSSPRRNCSHLVTGKCSDIAWLKASPCMDPCDRVCPRGHPCHELCHVPCPPYKTEVQILKMCQKKTVKCHKIAPRVTRTESLIDEFNSLRLTPG
ncbi:NFX1-type zinc finger-containing protein 1 [Aplysia californica]|uniref:NFX1-type zinc finger-containing protein 1 n=1 Tax=Aplysia californica TaxID=6500 RepID=A0ABM0JZH0_APLCA|nr:NFX1-type zinc finger-containing protein 1 [Aplysia californica]